MLQTNLLVECDRSIFYTVTKSTTYFFFVKVLFLNWENNIPEQCHDFMFVQCCMNGLDQEICHALMQKTRIFQQCCSKISY